LLFEELTRCSLFNYIAQPHKLIYALIWPHATRTFNIAHRRGTDRAHNYLALIEHRELNSHPIEIMTLDLASLLRPCNAPFWRDFIVPHRLMAKEQVLGLKPARRTNIASECRIANIVRDPDDSAPRCDS
jgi:hypothetical protein